MVYVNNEYVRKIDELGRIVVPKELRNNLKIQDNENVLIMQKDDNICISKYSYLENYSKFLNDIDFFNNTINKKVELSDIVKYNPSLMKSVKLKKERLQTFYELNQNTTELVSLKYNLLNKVQEMSQQIDSKTKDINDLVYKNESLSAQLSSIVDSRRWRMTNKVFNTINKIFRRSK